MFGRIADNFKTRARERGFQVSLLLVISETKLLQNKVYRPS